MFEYIFTHIAYLCFFSEFDCLLSIFFLRSFCCLFLIALNILSYIIFCLSWMIQTFPQFTKFKFVITEDFICYVWLYGVSLFFYCFLNYFVLTKILSSHEWINIWQFNYSLSFASLGEVPNPVCSWLRWSVWNPSPASYSPGDLGRPPLSEISHFLGGDNTYL